METPSPFPSSGKSSITNDFELLKDSLVDVQISKECAAYLHALKKRFPNIKKDIAPIIRQLQSGAVIGDQIPGIGFTVFKVRACNSDAQKGKSGGYRAIYYLVTQGKILLLAVYSKSDFEDLPKELIVNIIQNSGVIAG